MKLDARDMIAIIGIVAILILDGIALLNGLDGAMFGAAMASIGAIIGYFFKKANGKNGQSDREG